MAEIANPSAAVTGPDNPLVEEEEENLVPTTVSMPEHTVPGHPRKPHRDEVTGMWPVTYFSIAATCCVSILPFVRRAEDFAPPNRRPALAIFSKMSLTSSPKYRPLIIFSNLQFGEAISGSKAFGDVASLPQAQELCQLRAGAQQIRRPLASTGQCTLEENTVLSELHRPHLQ